MFTGLKTPAVWLVLTRGAGQAIRIQISTQIAFKLFWKALRLDVVMLLNKSYYSTSTTLAEKDTNTLE